MAEIIITLANGQEVAATAQNIAKNIREASKELSKAKIGTEEWAIANKKLDEAVKTQADIQKQIKGTVSASETLKQAWTKLPGAQYFNQISASFSMMKQGVGGLVSQFGVLKFAIAATGIGLLVIAFSTLVAWFQKTDEGATLLSGIFKGLGVVVDKVFGGMIDLFKGLSEYFTGKKSLKQGLIDLVEFIGNNLLNRVKAFLVIWNGITTLDLKKTTDGLIQLTTGVTDATDKMQKFGESVADAVKEGIDFEKQLDAIEDKARELSVLNAQTEKEVSKLILQSKNVGLTYKERIDLLDQASALELKNHSQQLANAKALEALRAKEIEDNATRNIQTDELDQALADATIARINLEKESINLQEKIANRRTALTEKEIAEQQKAAEEELKVINNIAQLKAQASEDGMAQELAQIKQQTAEKIGALKGSEEQVAEQRTLLLEIQEQQLAAVRKKYEDQQAAEDKKAIEEEEKRRKEASDKELADIQRVADEKNFILLQNLADGQISRRQFDDLAEQNQVKAWEDQLIALEEQGQKESALYEQIAGKIIDVELQKEEKIKKSRQQTFNAAVTLGNAIFASQLANIDRENAAGEKRLADIEARNGKESAAYKTAQAQLLATQRKNFEKKKKIEKSQIKINALAEIAGIIKSAVEIGGIYGLIVGALLSAATLVRANSAIKQVDSQQFADGGYVSGPSHAQGGIPGVVKGSRRPVEFEGGEFFFSKRAVDAIGVDNLSMLNNHYTHKLATGGPVNPFVNRAPVASAASSQAQQPNNQNDSALLAAKIDQLVAAQNARIDRIKVINVVSETDDGIKTLNTIKGNADV